MRGVHKNIIKSQFHRLQHNSVNACMWVYTCVLCVHILGKTQCIPIIHTLVKWTNVQMPI